MKSSAILADALRLAGILLVCMPIYAQKHQPELTVKSNVSETPKLPTKKMQSRIFISQSDEIKTLAEQFKAGKFQCELNETLTIEPNKTHAGYLTLVHKKTVANMLPVHTQSGALRLEERSSGLVWLQLPTKSMFMNSHIGQRLVDNCHLTN